MISQKPEKKFQKQHHAFLRGLQGHMKQSEELNFRLSNIGASELPEPEENCFDEFEFENAVEIRRSGSVADDYLKVCSQFMQTSHLNDSTLDDIGFIFQQRDNKTP